jgi:putative SOS response-associated peptidase YedK
LDAGDTGLKAPPDEARALLTPYAGELALRAVGRYVSNVNHEGPECLGDPEPEPRSRQDDAQGRLL